MSEYKKYQHLEKFGADEVDGILIGDCYIFPKIDGTNAHVWRDNGEIKAGSRNRELTLNNDNAGFCNWVNDNNEALQSVFNDLPEGSHIFGEWLVPHSLKTYREDAWRKFYVFDVYHPEQDEYLKYDTYSYLLSGYNVLNVISPLRIIKNPTLENIQSCLDENTYLIEEGKGTGEGVVVKNYDFRNRFDRITWAKLVTNEFKETHIKVMGAPVSNGTSMVEEKIVGQYVTKSLVQKEFAKIKNESVWTSKLIPRLLQTVYYCLVKEHCWEFVKANNNPKIDFKTLHTFTIREVKNVMPELF